MRQPTGAGFERPKATAAGIATPEHGGHVQEARLRAGLRGLRASCIHLVQESRPVQSIGATTRTMSPCNEGLRIADIIFWSMGLGLRRISLFLAGNAGPFRRLI